MILELINAIPFPDWISDTALKLGPVSIKWYGLGYVVGAFGAYIWAVRAAEKAAIWKPKSTASGTALVPDRKMLEDFLFFCFLGIFIGGRLGYVFFYDLGGFIEKPLDIIKVWQGGMSFHGGFLGVVAAVVYMAKTRKLPILRIGDMAAIGAPIGLFLVRLANFANQELYGRVTDVSWAIIFKDSFGADRLPRHPSQLYEAFLEGIVIFTVLWIATRKFNALTRPGLCCGLFLLMYGTFRIMVEFVREPDASLFGPLTRGMTYSSPMVIIGLIVIFTVLKRAPVAPIYPPKQIDSEKNAAA
jgi:phosphatidylglycerol:prolipoprotein diacylglycerol transferase